MDLFVLVFIASVVSRPFYRRKMFYTDGAFNFMIVPPHELSTSNTPVITFIVN